MAIYRQAGRRTWQIRLWIPERQRVVSISAETESETEARAKEADYRLALRARQDRARFTRVLDAILGPDSRPGHQRPGLALAAAYDAYLALPTLHLGARAATGGRYHWRRFVAFLARAYPHAVNLHDVDAAMGIAWLSAMKAEGLAPKTINVTRGTVATVFGRLATTAGLESNPFSRVPAVPMTRQQHGRAFTPAETARLLAAAAGTEWEGAILVALYTGQRYGDVARMTWAALRDVPVAEGRTVRCWDLAPAKTARHGIRGLLPLHPAVLTWLDAHPQPGPQVFPGLAKQYASTKGSPGFGRLLETAGIDRAGHVTFHCLRHTWASRMSAAGASQELLMRGGGWRQASTAQLYNHDVATLAEAVARLPDTKPPTPER